MEKGPVGLKAREGAWLAAGHSKEWEGGTDRRRDCEGSGLLCRRGGCGLEPRDDKCDNCGLYVEGGAGG